VCVCVCVCVCGEVRVCVYICLCMCAFSLSFAELCVCAILHIVHTSHQDARVLPCMCVGGGRGCASRGGSVPNDNSEHSVVRGFPTPTPGHDGVPEQCCASALKCNLHCVNICD